ncbi:MAG: single-stranded-DNA-specific exonuclease RecJ [Gammaproteobacteria bacterium]|nr:single-stranded-DNA-specific exonuclease RecJ [Gammaproteobacteria bacterium]MBT8051949.1 single-stranded-DNA-specific exonuclease RecJ [Gammaproteobacteria bacterium]
MAREASGTIRGLTQDFNPVIRRVLLGRGIRDVQELSLGLADLIRPESFFGLDRAARLLAEAVMDGQSILVVGDFDADGATGTALALLSLRAMGCRRVDFRVPNRFEFGYGLSVPLVETLAQDPPDLLVTVDSGINCLAGVKRAAELGCRVIVTDHHLPGTELPAADAIVNPNQPDCDFPSKSLAGVGVMFYLLSAVRAQLRDRGWFGAARPEPNLAHFLDLVALGTVADLVPLDHNNRVLVRQGLERIRRGRARPGLMALLRAGKRDYRHVTAADLGFAAGPRLNAAGRLEDMSGGIRCLLSDDRTEAMEMAERLDRLNRQRRAMQDQMQQEAMVQLSAVLEALDTGDLPQALCLFDEQWHQGVVGLVASRVKDAVHRPVIAFAPEQEGASLLKGSARSVKGLHIRDVLALVDARQPGLMRAFGGHAMAAGLSLERERLSHFEEALSDAVRHQLDGEELHQEILTDGALSPPELQLVTALALEQAGPWGQRFPEPLFDGHFDVLERYVVGGSHLKMTVRHVEGGSPLDAIAFNRMPGDLPQSGAVRLLFRLGVNRWQGRETAQLQVEQIVG